MNLSPEFIHIITNAFGDNVEHLIAAICNFTLFST